MTYTGPNVCIATDYVDIPMGDWPPIRINAGGYYVREVRRSGEQRRSVYLEVVGTGRTIRVGRREFERRAKR